MSKETFGKCLDLFTLAANRNTLRLHNFGEVMLHPRLPELIRTASGRGIEISFFTNGVRPDKNPFSREHWLMLAEAGLRTVDFSAHEIPTSTFQEITDGIIRIGRVFDPQIRILGTWAGQTGPPELPTAEPCLFERDQAFVILWDGRVSACCLDVEGRRSELWVDDLLRTGTYHFEHISLCDSCASMRHHEEL